MMQMKASCVVMIRRSALRMYFMVLIKMLIYMHPKKNPSFLNYTFSNRYEHFLTVFFICDFFLQMEFWFNYKGRLKKEFLKNLFLVSFLGTKNSVAV